jgi:hypothetical protein
MPKIAILLFPSVRRHERHASGIHNNPSPLAIGRAAQSALISPRTLERHCNGAWGCRSFPFHSSPSLVRSGCLSPSMIGIGRQEGSRRPYIPRCDAACGDAIGNYRLVRRDVVGGDVFHCDLLLAPTSPDGICSQ